MVVKAVKIKAEKRTVLDKCMGGWMGRCESGFKDCLQYQKAYLYS